MNDNLISVNDARVRILNSLKKPQTIRVPISEAMNCVLSQDIHAPFDFPLFDNSSMDGYAVKSSDIRKASDSNPSTLLVVEDIPAGVVPTKHIGRNEASRIMTGAMLPSGADCVVPVEKTNMNWRKDKDATLSKTVQIFEPVQPGDYIRPIGEDFKKGQLVLGQKKLRAQDIGFLAMLGIAEIPIHKKPKIAIFSSGDELIAPGETLQSGKIYDSNTIMLSSLIDKYGGMPINLGVVKDTKFDVKRVLEEAVLTNADLIVSTAGVSVGAFDYVRVMLEFHGHLDFWRVNMRPGKPVAFGNYKAIPFIGLPGNPVSAFVGFEVFVQPAINKLSGYDEYLPRKMIEVELLDVVKSDGRESYLRGIVEYRNHTYFAKLTGHQGSGNLYSLVDANALLIMPSGVKSMPIGSVINAWLLD